MAVNMSTDSIAAVQPPTLQIASNNAPNLCVVSGPELSVREFQKQLKSENIACHLLQTSHAFHSAMVDPIIDPLREAIAKIHLRAPEKPFISTVTGRPITAAETTDPAYWARHARSTVEFGSAIQYLKEQGYDLFLECGPRSTLCSLTRKQFTPEHPCIAIQPSRHLRQRRRMGKLALRYRVTLAKRRVDFLGWLLHPRRPAAHIFAKLSL